MRGLKSGEDVWIGWLSAGEAYNEYVIVRPVVMLVADSCWGKASTWPASQMLAPYTHLADKSVFVVILLIYICVDAMRPLAFISYECIISLLNLLCGWFSRPQSLQSTCDQVTAWKTYQTKIVCWLTYLLTYLLTYYLQQYYLLTLRCTKKC